MMTYTGIIDGDSDLTIIEVILKNSIVSQCKSMGQNITTENIELIDFAYNKSENNKFIVVAKWVDLSRNPIT